MYVDKYQIASEEELTRFEFISEEPKGAICKLIEFQQTTDPETYNLAFGNKHPVTGSIDDLAVSDNGDTEKVLATVVAAVYVFWIAIRLPMYMHNAAPKLVHDFTEWESIAFMKPCNETFTSTDVSVRNLGTSNPVLNTKAF